jgi:deoxyadenosine/deoxycytidine kinase
MNTNRVVICSIEGNIGSGKSLLLDNLMKSDFPEVVFIKEPVDMWERIQDYEGENILQKFYKDPKKYSFSFQILALCSRINLLKSTIEENPQCKIIITERSLFTDKYVFADMLYYSGNMEDFNHTIYSQIFHSFTNDFHVDKVIYMKTPPEICSERILKRLRVGEDNIALDYLQTCHEYHENMIYGSPKICNKIHEIDGSNEITPELLKEWIDDIKTFLFL